MSAEDAERILGEIDVANPALSGRDIYPYKVKLRAALRAVASDPLNGFVVYPPNEVFELLFAR